MILAELLTRRRLIVRLAFLLAVLTGLWTSFTQPRYTSVAEVAVLGRSQLPSQLGAFAAQLGIGAQVGDITQSPQLVGELLLSRSNLRMVAADTIELAGRPVEIGDAVLSGVSDSAAAGQIESAVDILAAVAKARISQKSGLITVSVTTADPQLSSQILESAIAKLQQRLTEVRRERTFREAEFLRVRIDEIGAQVRHSQEDLVRFERANREYQRSPELRIEYARLRSDLDFWIQSRAAAIQAYESARAEIDRNSPSLAVLSEALVPSRPDSRGRVRKVLLAAFAGAVLACVWVLIFSRLQFSQDINRKEVLHDLLRPWRLLLP
jgi:uncharacterized protein involved in exopolysaccharide biosynthesis